MLKLYGTKVEIFLTTVLVFLQGSVVFNGNKVLLLVFLIITMSIFFLRGKKVESTFYYVLFGLITLIIIQTIIFSFFSWFTSLGTITRFLLPYFMVRLIGIRFIKHYINILYFFTIIGLIFFIPSIIDPSFYSFLQTIPAILGTDKFGEGTNFLIYTVESSARLGVFRNSGLFWEPGAHSGFLLMAMVFNILYTGKLWNARSFVFLIALLTTFSTAGYIGLVLLISFYYLNNLNNISSIVVVSLVILLSYYLFFKLDFLGDKISHEIELTANSDIEYAGRLGSGKKDFEDIIKHPLFGRGRNVATRFTDYNEENYLQYHRTNGVSDFIVKYGILFSLLYFYNMYKSLWYITYPYNYNKSFAKFILIIILVFGFSQTIFQGTFFISLIYLHVVVKDYLIKGSASRRRGGHDALKKRTFIT